MKKIAVVTGAESGLGLGIKNALEMIGYEVFVLPRIILTGNNKKQEIDAFFHGMMVQHGHIDLVVNNFGINHLSWIGTTQPDDEEIMIINSMCPYWVVNALEKHNGPCRVLNVSSQTYKVAQRCTTIYCGSKAALSHMTRVMARELAPKGWVINAFAPGKILGTEMSDKTDKQVNELRGWTQEQADKYAAANVPMGRFMSIEEASHIAVQITQLGDYINGETISATGGV